MKRKLLYSNDYMGLYSDGDLGISDGVGYVGSIDGEELRELYEALKKYFFNEIKKAETK